MKCALVKGRNMAQWVELLRRDQPLEGTRAKANKTTTSQVLHTFITACGRPRVLEEGTFVIGLWAVFSRRAHRGSPEP